MMSASQERPSMFTTISYFTEMDIIDHARLKPTLPLPKQDESLRFGCNEPSADVGFRPTLHTLIAQ